MVSGLSKTLWTKIGFELASVTKDVMRVQWRRLYFRAVINIERVADWRNVMKKRYCKLLTSSIFFYILNIIINIIIITAILIIGSDNSNTVKKSMYVIDE